MGRILSDTARVDGSTKKDGVSRLRQKRIGSTPETLATYRVITVPCVTTMAVSAGLVAIILLNGGGESPECLLCRFVAQHKLHADCGRIARLPAQTRPAWESRARCFCGVLPVHRQSVQGHSDRIGEHLERSLLAFGSLLHQMDAGVKPQSSSANCLALLRPRSGLGAKWMRACRAQSQVRSGGQVSTCSQSQLLKIKFGEFTKTQWKR